MDIRLFSLNLSDEQKESFLSKVAVTKNKKDCWEWTGAKKKKGYGNVRINKKYYLAHRVAFWIANGDFQDKFLVCHICDNPSCCNPNHLMLGTVKSNSADMFRKNRQQSFKNMARGEKNHNSKLRVSDILKIRNLYRSGIVNQYQLADMFNVSQPCIGQIIRRNSWRHVK